MKWLRAVTQQASFYMFYTLLGSPILRMASIFSRFALIPCSEMMKPCSFLEGTPKTHFSS